MGSMAGSWPGRRVGATGWSGLMWAEKEPSRRFEGHEQSSRKRAERMDGPKRKKKKIKEKGFLLFLEFIFGKRII
jgi:hypothetical protein